VVDRTQRPDVPLTNPNEAAHRRELALRANASLPKDGGQAMTAPLRLLSATAADLAGAVLDPALWAGAMVAAGGELVFSDGVAWHRLPRPIVKTADESTTSDTSFDDDAALKFAVEASKKYWFRFTVFYNTPTAADFKWQLAGPASPTLIVYDGMALAPGATALTVTRDAAFASSHALTETSGTIGKVVIEGFLHNGANAGTVALQWAQNTSNGSATTVRAGSRLEYGTVE
jgi:hypothetical protein